MSAKVKKLEDQFRSDSAIQQQRDGNSSSIFSGVAIYVNGLTGEPLIFLRICIMGLMFTILSRGNCKTHEFAAK